MDMSDRVKQVLDADCGLSLQPFMERHSEAEADELIGFLSPAQNASPARIQRAIFLLGRIGKRSAVQPIVSMLDGLDEGGRIAAADAFGPLDTPEALRATLQLSRDGSPQVRKFAATALGQKSGTTALDRLRTLANEDSEPFLRLHAKRLLDRHGTLD